MEAKIEVRRMVAAVAEITGTRCPLEDGDYYFVSMSDYDKLIDKLNHEQKRSFDMQTERDIFKKEADDFCGEIVSYLKERDYWENKFSVISKAIEDLKAEFTSVLEENRQQKRSCRALRGVITKLKKVR